MRPRPPKVPKIPLGNIGGYERYLYASRLTGAVGAHIRSPDGAKVRFRGIRRTSHDGGRSRMVFVARVPRRTGAVAAECVWAGV